MTSLPSIDLDIAQRLKEDPKFRQAYFLAESSGMIARQLIRLRKRRGLSQKDVARELETRQPAISRVESADYCNWSFNTLRRLAEAMDARLRVIIEPAEDILREYEAQKDADRKVDALLTIKRTSSHEASQQHYMPHTIVETPVSAANSISELSQRAGFALSAGPLEKQKSKQWINNQEMAGAACN